MRIRRDSGKPDKGLAAAADGQTYVGAPVARDWRPRPHARSGVAVVAWPAAGASLGASAAAARRYV